jgi:hypothetical protein
MAALLHELYAEAPAKPQVTYRTRATHQKGLEHGRAPARPPNLRHAPSPPPRHLREVLRALAVERDTAPQPTTRNPDLERFAKRVTLRSVGASGIRYFC